MNTYLTLDGDVLDLSTLSKVEAEFFDDLTTQYRRGADWRAFSNRAFSLENPLLADGVRRTPQTVTHPLYQALSDMVSRLQITQGAARPADGDDLDRDPFADEGVTVTEAARERGITRPAVYKAVDRGDLVAEPGPPVRVSRNSLDRWEVNESRQSARKARSEPIVNARTQ